MIQAGRHHKHSFILLFVAMFLSLLIHGSVFYSVHVYTDERPHLKLATKANTLDVKIVNVQEKKDIRIKKRKLEKGQSSDRNQIVATNSSIISRAKIIGEFKINYPKVSRLLKEQGTVIVLVTVNSFGRPIKTKMIKSSGFSRLDKHALIKIKEAKFAAKKIKRDGRLISIDDNIEISLDFKLKNNLNI